MSAGAFVGRNAKTVVSLIGGVISVLATATALLQYAPAHVAGVGTALFTILEVLRTANVWIVRNETLIEAAADAVEDLAESLTAAVEHPDGNRIPGAG
ncbi:hypothetical protein [Nocardia sp. NPDC052566]|uniref:hypothetical protein n=1 Tax=Nocardia sp. NPDC052566 TaxID=3364330 RepID=UPI0037C6AE1E